MAVIPKKFYLFNCDNTYNLDIVENFLLEANKKYGFGISVEKLSFGLPRMADVVNTGLPSLEMNFAIFVVHANESRLSINEESAGIGYAKLYRALLQKTDDKVLIVIGGDTYYKDEDEKNRFVISRWARRKVASQFNEAYLDGRKSFIFSWGKKQRPIHEEALRHYFDPSKKGLKFVYTPPKPLPRPPSPKPFMVEDDRRGLLKDQDDGRRRRTPPFNEQPEIPTSDGVEQSSYGATGAGAVGTPAAYPAGKVLLEVQLRYGRITYLTEERLGYRERWQPPEWQLADLRDRYRTKPEVTVQFIADGRGGASCRVVESPDCCTWFKNCLRSCCSMTWRFLVACFLGLVHCIGWFWGWLCDDRRR